MYIDIDAKIAQARHEEEKRHGKRGGMLEFINMLVVIGKSFKLPYTKRRTGNLIPRLTLTENLEKIKITS